MKRKSIFSRVTAALLCMLFVIMGADVPVSADDGINVGIFVRDSSGNDIAGAKVIITSTTNPAHTDIVMSNSNGACEFTHFDWPATEQYTITTSIKGYVTDTRTYTGTSSPISIVLWEESKPVTITLVQLKIAVVYGQNNPFPNAYVKITENGTSTTYQTDSNGILNLWYPFITCTVLDIEVSESENFDEPVTDKITITSKGLVERTYLLPSVKTIFSNDRSVWAEGDFTTDTRLEVTQLDPNSDEFKGLEQSYNTDGVSSLDWSLASQLNLNNHPSFGLIPLGQDNLRNDFDLQNALLAGYKINLKSYPSLANTNYYTFYGYRVRLVRNNQEIQPSNPIDINFNVGNQYNGRSALVYHLKDNGSTEVFTTIVDEKGVTVPNVTSLHSFMVVILNDTSVNSSSSNYNIPVFNSNAVFKVEYKDYDLVEYLKYNKINNLPVPKKEGYIFAGWYTNPQLTIEFKAGSRVTRNMMLYPKWIKNNNN